MKAVKRIKSFGYKELTCDAFDDVLAKVNGCRLTSVIPAGLYDIVIHVRLAESESEETTGCESMPDWMTTEWKS